MEKGGKGMRAHRRLEQVVGSVVEKAALGVEENLWFGSAVF